MDKYNLTANAIRALSMDSVERANSGHPGMPMGMAEIGITLWKNHLSHNPKNPKWVNRDRFILSNGHGSMLLYSLLHLTGYNLSIDDLKQFRQLHSKTPGHPEYGYTDGVETTTGPLGQGLANAVGMAISERILANEFNQPDFSLIDHYTYTFIGDGCLMEGISHEVCSLAGTIGLNKLIVLYDDNGISIDGNVAPWFNEDVAARFRAYNWNVIEQINGHDVAAIDNAIACAKLQNKKPTLIICKTTIGFGSPNKAGCEESHGSPLGAKEIELTRKQLNWNHPPFIIPKEVYDFANCVDHGQMLETKWNELFNQYSSKYPEHAHEFQRRINHTLPQNINKIIHDGIALANSKAESIASRKASQNAIEYFAQFMPELFGGSADLTGSNLTKWKKATSLDQNNNFTGNYLSYGVREFGMSAILNGIFLHGGLRPFGGTFLTFSDYSRNALRMASIMKIAPIFVFTHDSIGLGEDGPTHQPIEHLASLRLIPNMDVWRPCDSVETMAAWGYALSQTQTPSSLIFSRQNLKFIQRDETTIANIAKGGYILQKNNESPDIVIIATGSEVELAYQLYEYLTQNKQKVQIVSMPSTSVFDKQEQHYRDIVIPQAKLKIAIEAGVSDSWYKYVGSGGLIFGIDTFGESAPANQLFNCFGLTFDKILARVTLCL